MSNKKTDEGLTGGCRLHLVIFASQLIHRLEKWIKEKMIEKNKLIHLTAAKKTV